MGDGTIVDVYYDSEPNDVTICVVDVYVGEIASVNTTAADPYVVVVPASTMTAKNLSTFTLSGNERRFETTDSFDEETVVLFTYSQSANEIKSVVAAEYVEGTVAEYVSGDNLTVGETKYDYAKNIAFSFGAESDMQTKGDYVVYVDQNGYAIYVDEPEFNPTDYAYILNAETAGSAAFGRDQAKLVTAQGKLMTVDTDDNYTDLIGKIVTYREDESGDYALRAAPNSYQNAASFTRNFDSDGKTNDASGILKGASWGFDLKNSNASITVGAGSWEDGVQIQIDSDNDGAKDDPLTTVYANSETVFVVARTDSSAPYNTTYTAYVGVRNVPNIDGTRANVEATYYVRGNNIVAFMFIDAGRATVTGGSNDVVFLAGAEGMKGHVYSNDGSDYYLYNAVVSGKVTQVKVDANLTVGSFDGGDETNFLIQSPVTNNKGIIGPDTYLMTLQNGSGHEDLLGKFVPQDHIIIGTTQHNASVAGPGATKHGGSGMTHMGCVVGEAARLQKFADTFTACGLEADVSDGVQKMIWNKLFTNVSASALTGALQVPLGYIPANEHAWKLCCTLIREAVDAAKGLGMDFDYDEKVAEVKAVCDNSPNGLTSIYADLKNGRRSEVDYRLIDIVDAGESYSVSDFAAAAEQAARDAISRGSLPIVCGEQGMNDACGVATISVDYGTLGELAAQMAYDILVKGAKPAETPVKFSAQEDLTYSIVENIAEGIGFTIPQAVKDLVK